MTSNLRVRKVRAGFTLVELLTVIAIIAILAAILFPVAATVQESARRGATMSNLQKIHQAITAYELDNREYPEFLFGPAICRTNGKVDVSCSDFYTMRETASLVTGRYRTSDPEYLASRNARKVFQKSLYPEYIRDLDTFQAKNNSVASPSVNLVRPATRFSLLDPVNSRYLPRTTASLPGFTTQSLPFYAYDSFDASPVVTDAVNGAISSTLFAARYARQWMPVVDNATLDAMTPADLQTYQRQLLWARPPSETVVTMTTHHVPKGKVLVLWQGGTAKVLDVRKLGAMPSAAPAGDYQFWKLSN